MQRRIPNWLTIDLLIICVPLAIIGLAALIGI
jgi:Flp pilus assembly protein protease CpaA